MATIPSSKIKAFPVGNRGTGTDTQAAEMTEYNLTNIINSLYPRDAFVVSLNKEQGNAKIVLKGYYFEITNDDTIKNTASSADLWAHIGVSGSTSNYNRLMDISGSSDTVLDTTLSDSQFKGLVLNNTESGPAGSNCHLQLLHNGSVPSTSLIHWKTGEILDGTSSTPITEQLTGVNATFSTISANTKFVGALEGGFTQNKTITLSGPVTGTVSSLFDGEATVEIETQITDSAVTPAKLQYAYTHTDVTYDDDARKLVITISATKAKPEDD